MANTKKLQKVTDFEKVESKKQVREYLEAKPDSYYDLLDNLQNRLQKSYNEKLGEDHKLMDLIYECHKSRNDEKAEAWARNATYEYNHTIIATNIHNYLMNNRTFPTIHHIANETGLSRTTIYRHLQDGLKTDYNSLVKGKLEYMATHALEKLYLIGIQDNNAGALKSYIELSGAINKQPTTNVNNYIQINNLRISRDEFDQLPNETIIEIEKIISETLENTRIKNGSNTQLVKK